MAARTEAVAGVSRIQAVNTPPEQRRRGYASAGVAALSASVLAQGLRCVLHANVSNVAATSVYQRLGYRAVSDLRSLATDDCSRYRVISTMAFATRSGSRSGSR